MGFLLHRKLRQLLHKLRQPLSLLRCFREKKHVKDTVKLSHHPSRITDSKTINYSFVTDVKDKETTC